MSADLQSIAQARQKNQPSPPKKLAPPAEIGYAIVSIPDHGPTTRIPISV
jgi:hypothetical protein